MHMQPELLEVLERTMALLAFDPALMAADGAGGASAASATGACVCDCVYVWSWACAYVYVCGCVPHRAGGKQTK